MTGPATSAVILAGGLGTRLRGVVADLPKPMAPVAGRPFLERLLAHWIAQGIGRFVLSVGYRHEAIVDHFGGAFEGAPLDYAIEESPLGTGGGLLLAAQKLGGDSPFLLLNGDTYFPVDWKALRAFSAENDADWVFSLFRASEPGRYMGLEVAPSGRVVSLNSGSDQPGRRANGGVYWVRPRALLGGRYAPGDKVSLEDELFPAALASGQRLFAAEFSQTFIDIGLPDDYRRSQSLLAEE